MKNTEENCDDMENTKKIVKRFGKYWRKINLIMIRYGKQRRKQSKDLENMEERKVEQ